MCVSMRAAKNEECSIAVSSARASASTRVRLAAGAQVARFRTRASATTHELRHARGRLEPHPSLRGRPTETPRLLHEAIREVSTDGLRQASKPGASRREVLAEKFPPRTSGARPLANLHIPYAAHRFWRGGATPPPPRLQLAEISFKCLSLCGTFKDLMRTSQGMGDARGKRRLCDGSHVQRL